MGKPYSMDLRERVVAAIEGGEFDAPGGGAVFDRNSDSWDVGAAETGHRGRSPCKTGQAEGGGAGRPRGFHSGRPCRSA